MSDHEIVKRSEKIALVFDLDLGQIIELAADVKLCEEDFANAISLYRQAGCKHLKVSQTMFYFMLVKYCNDKLLFRWCLSLHPVDVSRNC